MASAGPTAGPFSQAVQAVLDSWSVLQVAVENGFGGADSSAKARWMVDAVTQWFGENSDLDPYEVEDFLADILNNEFNTLADDGSLKAIAEMICQSYSLVAAGRLDELAQRLSSLPKASKAAQQQTTAGDDDSGDSDSDDNAMDTGASTSNNVTNSSANNTDVSDNNKQDQVDADGWTQVKKGKKR